MPRHDYGIRLVALYRTPIDEWLTAYDPERTDPDNPDAPTGWIDGSTDHAQALRFASLSDAVEFTMQVSKVKPLRPDGLPNRPLRAFTIEFKALPEVPEKSSPEG